FILLLPPRSTLFPYTTLFRSATCTPFLARQIEIVRPQVIITVGRPSAQHMLQTKISMGKLRGQWYQWRGIKLMPTYHPAYVLRKDRKSTRLNSSHVAISYAVF